MLKGNLLRIRRCYLKIFELSTDANNYQNLVPVNIASWDIINNIALKNVANNWNPIELEFISKRRKKEIVLL